MGNLTEIKKDGLINVLSAEKAGVYKDSHVIGTPTAKVKALTLRELGYTFFAFGTKDRDYGFIKSVTSVGQAKVGLYELNNAAPLNAAAFDTAVRIDPIYKDPGVDKPMYYSAPSLGGVYNVAVSNGLVTPASMRLIIDDMCEQAYSDEENNFFVAGMAFHITGYSDSDNAVINGTTYDGANIDAQVAAINAGSDAYAYKTDTDAYVIILKKAYTSLTTESTVDTDKPYLGILAISADVMFDTFFQRGLKSSMKVQAGIFPYLTSDEVARIVRNRANQGELSIIAGSDVPIQGVAYAKYYIWSSSNAYNNQTPGGDLKHINGFNLYVPVSEVGKDYWDASDFNDITGGTPDSTFDELLADWVG